ncbi:Adventurous gliding motility protein K [Vulgatibacter incomptus]|uniref:Adventurous gliding motility protein K n=1 Tax=Vulgatibacter incomptus TaxID=1391653 RepID=A0A0K1PCM4_9BACT|nr:Adventurous gliding motility protein K [Vulgatibacter incomptus]
MFHRLTPGDPASFASLEESLREKARWAELLHLYEGRIEREGPDASELMVRAAGLLLDQLEDPDRAEAWLRRLHEQDPNHVAGREGLKDLYEERGDHAALCELLEREALRAATPEEAAEAYVSLGRLLDRENGRKPHALEMWQRALRLVEDHPQALALAREANVELGRLEAAKGIVERELAARPGESTQGAGRLAALAALALERPFRHELADALARSAVAVDPDCAPARAVLDGLQRRRAEWTEEARGLRARAVEERDRKAASRLYVQIAALHGVYDSSPDGEEHSREALERAFLLWPGNPDALELLEHRHASAGDFAGLAVAYEALVPGTPDPADQAELKVRLANLYGVRFDDRPRSLEALEQAATLDPSRRDAVVPLLEVFEDDGRSDRAVELLERHLNVVGSAAQRGPGTAVRKPVEPTRETNALRVRLAELLLGLGEEARARRHLEAALRLDSRLERAESLLMPLLASAGESSVLAGLLERRSDRIRDPGEKRDLLERAASSVEAPAERLRLLGRAFLVAPENHELHEELEAAGRLARSSGDVARFYHSALVSVSDRGVQRRILERLSHVLEKDLGRPGDAAHVLEQLRAFDPANAETATQLERLLSLAGEGEALAEAWRTRLAQATDPTERRSLLEKLAAHHEAKPEAAVEIYRRLLELGPDEGVERKLAAALGALGRWAEQRDALESLASRPGEARAAARAELARLLATRLDRPGEAAELYLRILAESPEQPGVVDALEALVQAGVEAPRIAEALAPLFAARGEWHRHAAMLEARLGAESEPAARGSILASLAEIHEERLGDARAAFAALTRAFAESPSTGPVLDSLERLGLELGARAELVGIFRNAWRGPDAALDRELAGRAIRAGGDEELVAAAHHRLLELDPESGTSLAALEALAASGERWDEADSYLERLLRSQRTESPDLHLRRAGYLRRLGRHEDAATALRAALAAGADERAVLPRLTEALEAAGLRAELADVLSRQIDHFNEAGDLARASALALQRAKVLEESGSRAAAVADYAAILAIRSRDPEALVGLEGLLGDPEARVAAARALERPYIAAAEWRKLHGVLEIQIDSSDDPAWRAKELRRLAQLSARELKSPALSFAALARAFEDSPEDALLRSELRVAAAECDCLEELADLVASVAERRAGTLPPTQLLALERELAELYEKRLGDRKRATERYERMRRLDPSSFDALRGLHRLSREEGDPVALYESCMALAAVVYDLRERLALWREAAVAAGADPVRAAACWRKIAEADPKDAEALVHLDGFHAAGGDPQELAWVVERRRDLSVQAGETLAARELAVRLAGLRRSLGDSKGALELYREIVAADPDHVDACEALTDWARSHDSFASTALEILEPILRATGEHELRVELREARLSGPADSEERARRFIELREILETELERPDRAFAVCARAFAERLETDPAHLERLASAAGKHAELADLYEATLRRDPESSLGLQRRVAELRQQDDPRAAIAAWQAVAAEAPGDRDAIAALERLHRSIRDWDALDELLARKAELEADPASRLALLLERARLLHEDARDPDRAVAALRAVLALSPDEPAALELLVRLLEDTARWADLAEHMEGRLADPALGLDDRLRLRARLAAIRKDHMEDLDRALALHAANLAEFPAHPESRAALDALVADRDPSLRARAASVLAPILEAENDHRRLLELLEAIAAVERDPPNRASLYSKMASIYAGPLDSPEMAFLSAGRALRADPDDSAHLEIAVSAAVASGAEDELAGLLAECSMSSRTGEARVRLLRSRATLCESSGDARGAAEAWKSVHALAPDDLDALRAIARLDAGQQDPRGHVAVLRSLLAREEDPGLAAAHLLEIARMQEERLGEPDAALASLRRVLELDAGNKAALDGMERLCLAVGSWGELAELLDRRAHAEADASSRHGMLARLAELRDGRLGDRAGALDALHRILSEDPANFAAVDKLEVMLEGGAGADLLEPLALLEGACRATRNWQRCAELVERRASIVADPEARKAALLELADLRQGSQQRPDLAFLALGRAFREEPSDEALWERIAAVAVAADSVEEWLAIADEQLGRIGSPASAARLALHLATVSENKAHDDAGAIRWLQRARGLDLSTEPAVLPALERLLSREQRWEELAEVLGRLAHASEPAHRIETLVRLGQLAERQLRDPERAVVAYEAVLALDPEHQQALRALAPLYEGKGATDELLENLVRQRRVEGGEAQTALLQRIAELAATLGRADVAIEHSREILARDPRNEAALSRLEALYEEAGKFDDLAGLLRSRLAHTLDPREIVRLNERLGLLHLGRLDAEDDAIASFRAVLDRDPRNRKALEALRKIHASRGEAGELVGILRRLIPLQDGAAEVKAVRIELAEAFLAMGSAQEALDSLKRVLDLEPHTLAELERVEAIFRAKGAWTEVIRCLEARAALESEENAIDLWAEMARILDVELGRKGAGAAPLEKILERRPADRQSFDRLRELYRAGADWRRYARATERFAVHCPDDEEKTALLRELATVLADRLGQKELAFAKLGAAFELSPDRDDLRAELERIAAETGMQEELTMIYESVADGAGAAPVAQALWLARGRLLDRELDDAAEAEASYRRILEHDPLHAGALDALVGLHRRRRQHRALVLVLEQKLEGVALDEKRGLLLEVARIHDEELHDTGEAIYSLRRAFEMDPGDQAVLDALSDLYRRERKFTELAAILARTRDLASDDVRKIALQLRLASIQEVDLEDPDAAAASYARVLEIAPANLDAMEALERLFTHHDRYAELLHVYDRKLQVVEDPRERIRIFFKAGTIWEQRLQNPGNAIACLEGVLSFEPENLLALRELARLLRDQRSWDRLAAVYRHHDAVIADDPALRAERVELRVRLGEVLLDELGDPAGAEAAHLSALELDVRCRSAIAALAGIYERSGNWPQALAMLEQEAHLAAQTAEAVELHHRIGRIHADMLQDRIAARAAFDRALELDRDHVPTLSALRAIFRAEDNQDAYLRVLEQEAGASVEAAEKARLHVELGRHLLDERGDPDAAIRSFEEARRHLPGDPDAAMALSELYVEREDWAGAETVLDVVCASLEASGGDPSLLTRKTYRLGFVCARLGKGEKARRCYARAYELDPTFLPAAEGLAHQVAAAGDHAQALKVFQAILIHHRDDLTDPEVVEIHFTIGEIRRKLGDEPAAKKSLRNALDLDPWHAESHRAMIAIADKEGDGDLGILHRQKLIEVVDDDEKLELLRAIAERATGQLGDHYLAIDSYVAALRLRPDDPGLLEGLAELYRETRQGHKAMEILERLLALPAVAVDPARGARAHTLAGVLAREEADRDPSLRRTAMSHFNDALDLDWHRTDAFQALEAILVEARDYRGLEAAYVRMIERLAKAEGTKAARTVLFRTLADLYQEALADSAAAIEAYKAVTVLAPDDAHAAQRYASLLGNVRGAEAEAIGAWRQALPLLASPTEAARSLVRLQARRKDYDSAYSSAQVVSSLLGQGGADEEGILQRLKGFAKDSAARPLTERHWREHLLHEELRGVTASILALIQEQAGSLFAKDHGELKIDGREVRIDRKRDRVDVPTSMLFFVSAYRQVAKALGLEAVELFKVQGVTGLHLAGTLPPSLVAGEELFTDQRPKKELYFHIGRMLAWTRPELAMTRLRSRAEVELIVESAVALGVPGYRARSNPDALDKVKKRLARTVSAPAHRRLEELGKAYAAARPDLGAYIQAAEASANRAGALLAGDLAIVSRCLAADGPQGGAEAMRRDLVEFALSESWTTLRKDLGLAVVVPNS